MGLEDEGKFIFKAFFDVKMKERKKYFKIKIDILITT